MRVDGKFLVGNDIPEGQASVNALLAECYDISYELRTQAEENDSDWLKRPMLKSSLLPPAFALLFSVALIAVSGIWMAPGVVGIWSRALARWGMIVRFQKFGPDPDPSREGIILGGQDAKYE